MWIWCKNENCKHNFSGQCEFDNALNLDQNGKCMDFEKKTAKPIDYSKVDYD